jgi:hypothetical protein
MDNTYLATNTSVQDKKNYDTNWNTDDADWTDLRGFFGIYAEFSA